MASIYVLENKTNGKVYVGQTTQTFNQRLKSHLNGKQYIDKAIQKYSLDNFKITVMDCPEGYLDWMEQEWIKEMDSLTPHGYNLDSGGKVNRKFSEETREKMRQNNKGEGNPNFGNHAIAGERNFMYGKTHTPEARKKISQSKKGKPSSFMGQHFSDESKQTLSKSIKEWHKRIGRENHPSAKSVINLTTGEIFPFIGIAAEHYRIDQSSISRCCSGIYKTAAGYKWQYLAKDG